MGLISTEVEVTLSSKKISYYDNLGYEIPKVKTLYGMCTPRGTKITVKPEDLSSGSHVKVTVQCDGCSKIYKTTYQVYYNHNHDGKIYCNSCANKLFNSGENHPRWNFNKSYEERLMNRRYPEYTTFVKSVLARDNYTCQCCGKKSDKDMVVHHLYGYSGYPEYRTDQKQAIVMCGNCHNAFHFWHQQIYGFKNKGNCTRGQFEEWYGKSVGCLQQYDKTLLTARQIFDYEENKVYQNAKEYADIHKVCDTNVYNCCNHKVKKRKYINSNGEVTYYEDRVRTVGGHHLLWFDEYEKMTLEELDNYLQKDINKTLKKVICLTTGKVFDGIIYAAKYYEIDRSGIGECCKGKYKSSGKLNGIPLQWMYLSNFEKLSKEDQESILSRNKEE